MMPPTIDSREKPPIFVGGGVVLVEVFAELVVFEPWVGAVCTAGPPNIEMTPSDEVPVKVRVRFAPLTDT